MPGEIGLDEDFARPLAPARAPGDLDQEREESLPRAEVRAEKRAVRLEDADQREVGVIVPLREHLRAHEDVDLPGADLAERFRQGATRGRSIAIHAGDDGPR